MTPCYLYLIKHACGHIASYKRNEPIDRAKYNQYLVTPCPVCEAHLAAAALKVPEEPPESILDRSTIWKRNRQSCDKCGKLASLRKYKGEKLCQGCYRASGAMDAKSGICQGCRAMRQRWYANGKMLCRRCLAKTKGRNEIP
jgi:hypothetical protein